MSFLKVGILVNKVILNQSAKADCTHRNDEHSALRSGTSGLEKKFVLFDYFRFLQHCQLVIGSLGGLTLNSGRIIDLLSAVLLMRCGIFKLRQNYPFVILL